MQHLRTASIPNPYTWPQNRLLSWARPRLGIMVPQIQVSVVAQGRKRSLGSALLSEQNEGNQR